MSAWERKKILISGKTRPELSRRHRENVCTGGIFADTMEFVRLFPIPLRYLDDERVFKKYQWIEADVRRAVSDPRPESHNIRWTRLLSAKQSRRREETEARGPMGYATGTRAPVGQSVRECWNSRGTSIGMIKPDEVLNFPVHAYPPGERVAWQTKYDQILSQQQFDFDGAERRDVQPISPPDFRFKVRFKSGGETHVFSVFDWEIDALYYRLRRLGAAVGCLRKMVERLREVTCPKQKDTYFFLGNISTHPHIFTIVGLWYPARERKAEPLLF